MKLNVDDYIDDLEEFDLTRKQKEEVLQALWELMEYFVLEARGVLPPSTPRLPDFGPLSPEQEARVNAMLESLR